MIPLAELAAVDSVGEVAEVVARLRAMVGDPGWQNPDAVSFLEACGSWLSDARRSGWSHRFAARTVDEDSWRDVGGLLLRMENAAKRDQAVGDIDGFLVFCEGWLVVTDLTATDEVWWLLAQALCAGAIYE